MVSLLRGGKHLTAAVRAAFVGQVRISHRRPSPQLVRPSPERDRRYAKCMPFTVSHAAAVLPLQRFGSHKLPLTALMIGSMAPDFGYFFSREESRRSHTASRGCSRSACPWAC